MGPLYPVLLIIERRVLTGMLCLCVVICKLSCKAANPELDPEMISSIFVYGTLKRQECRGAMWPCRPRGMRPAWTHGALFDRSDYPAMTNGTDRVSGERWDFQYDEMQQVLEVLDAIEGANQPGSPDLYRRLIVDTWDLPTESVEVAERNTVTRAYTYHYANDPLGDGFMRVSVENTSADPDSQYVCWSALPRQ